ncbi:hypothetical protein ACIA8K_23305 [Catenuloplanes sp. NPDC051500]|uniref:hypothetical protein n=1 Tax=Catenuloplanes sp. NPDC051500 TaxID=3363959 RepID=UPI0037A85B2B
MSLVCPLPAVPWQIKDFTISGYDSGPRDLGRLIRAEGCHAHRSLTRARRP